MPSKRFKMPNNEMKFSTLVSMKRWMQEGKKEEAWSEFFPLSLLFYFNIRSHGRWYVWLWYNIYAKRKAHSMKANLLKKKMFTLITFPLSTWVGGKNNKHSFSRHHHLSYQLILRFPLSFQAIFKGKWTNFNETNWYGYG